MSHSLAFVSFPSSFTAVRNHAIDTTQHRWRSYDRRGERASLLASVVQPQQPSSINPTPADSHQTPPKGVVKRPPSGKQSATSDKKSDKKENRQKYTAAQTNSKRFVKEVRSEKFEGKADNKVRNVRPSMSLIPVATCSPMLPNKGES